MEIIMWVIILGLSSFALGYVIGWHNGYKDKDYILAIWKKMYHDVSKEYIEYIKRDQQSWK